MFIFCVGPLYGHFSWTVYKKISVKVGIHEDVFHREAVAYTLELSNSDVGKPDLSFFSVAVHLTQ